MTQNEKDLLLKDLCARLSYGVKVQSYSYEDDIETVETLYNIDSDGYMSTLECDTLKNIAKPYLFPLSSMTEEQKKEISKRYNYHNHYAGCVEITYHSQGYWDDDNSCNLQDYLWLEDWYNKNHLDYRGLIEKGLAIDATGLNIY